MLFSDLELSRRLERAEAHACRRFAEARCGLFPDSGAEWMECAGAYAVFDGVDSPLTQSFGLGVFEELTPAALDTIEAFFAERGAPVHHEVSPFVGVPALDLLCARGYRPIEISSVLYRPVAEESHNVAGVNVRVIGASEAQLWNDVSAQGWTHEHPELGEFLRVVGAISTAREDGACFLAEIDGKPGAAGALSLHGGIALLAGASTIPSLRRRGLQTALLDARIRYAAEHGCDVAMMVAEVGSNSQRNAERKGFRIAYTRTKWQLASQA